MKKTANQRRLKNYLIVNKTHFKLLIINLILMLAIFAVIILEVMCPFYQEIYKINDIYAQSFSAKFFVVLLDRLSIALLVIFLIGFLYQVMINHKICGPLINFSNTFKKMSQGDLTRKVYLRQYDFHKNEAAQVNDMIDSLSNYIMTLKKDHDCLLSMIEDASKDKITGAEYQHLLDDLRKHVDICHQHLSIFKINGKDDRESECRSDV